MNIKTLISKILAVDPSEVQIFSLSGGCIHHVFEVRHNTKRFCIKVNKAEYFPMFQAEMEGLQALGQTQCLRVPQPYKADIEGDFSFLLMEFIEEGQRGKRFWDTFAAGLACLHRHSSDYFGWHSDNFIGILPQKNRLCEDWTTFYVSNRIEPLTKQAFDKGLLQKQDLRAMERLCAKVSQYFPEEPPALLHGDLWGGNYLIDKKGNPVLIDPAVYYGHREMELAFTTLFGGFSQRFYDAYQEHFPLQPGFNERKPLYNLYYLLVHLVLFGEAYLNSVRNILQYFA